MSKYAGPFGLCVSGGNLITFRGVEKGARVVVSVQDVGMRTQADKCLIWY